MPKRSKNSQISVTYSARNVKDASEDSLENLIALIADKMEVNGNILVVHTYESRAVTREIAAKWRGALKLKFIHLQPTEGELFEEPECKRERESWEAYKSHRYQCNIVLCDTCRRLEREWREAYSQLPEDKDDSPPF